MLFIASQIIKIRLKELQGAEMQSGAKAAPY
jgi:hypothetical protein